MAIFGALLRRILHINKFQNKFCLVARKLFYALQKSACRYHHLPLLQKSSKSAQNEVTKYSKKNEFSVTTVEKRQLRANRPADFGLFGRFLMRGTPWSCSR